MYIGTVHTWFLPTPLHWSEEVPDVSGWAVVGRGPFYPLPHTPFPHASMTWQYTSLSLPLRTRLW